MYDPKKRAKLRVCTPVMATAVATAMPANVANVTRAPPSLSASHPPTGRDSEPISAPMKPRPAR